MNINSILNGVISSAIWAALAAVLVSLWTFFSKKYRKKKKYVLWSLFDRKKELAIMMSLRSGSHPTSTKRTSLSEAIALADVIPIYKELGMKYKVLPEYSKDIEDNFSNILSMGGPTANQLTKDFLEKYNLPVELKYKPDNPEIRTTQVGIQCGNRLFVPKYSEDEKKIEIDYSLIVGIFDKNTENRRITVEKAKIIVVGCHGYGTRGGIEWLQGKEFTRKFKKFNKNSFVAIVKCEVHNNGKLTLKNERYIAIEQ